MPKALQVYIRHSEKVISTSLTANLVHVVADHVPLPDPKHVPTAPPLPIVESDSFASSDLDLPIALRKDK